jgi:hypothetical protein
MEDWEALAYEDDFESRYADELELLEDLDGQFYEIEISQILLYLLLIILYLCTYLGIRGIIIYPAMTVVQIPKTFSCERRAKVW